LCLNKRLKCGCNEQDLFDLEVLYNVTGGDTQLVVLELHRCAHLSPDSTTSKSTVNLTLLITSKSL